MTCIQLNGFLQVNYTQIKTENIINTSEGPFLHVSSRCYLSALTKGKQNPNRLVLLFNNLYNGIIVQYLLFYLAPLA